MLMCIWYAHTYLNSKHVYIYELIYAYICIFIYAHIAIPSCSVYICTQVHTMQHKGVCMDLVPHKVAQVNMYALVWKRPSKYEGTRSKQEARGAPTIQISELRVTKDLERAGWRIRAHPLGNEDLC